MCAPFELDEAAVQLGVERGQLIEQRAASLQARHKEGRQRRVQQDALRSNKRGGILALTEKGRSGP